VSASDAAELRAFVVAVALAVDRGSEPPEISLAVPAARTRRTDRRAFDSSTAVVLDRCSERRAFTGHG